MKKWIWILSGLVLLIIGGVYVNRHLPEWMIKGGLAYVQKTDYALILESDKVSLDTDQKAVAKDVLQTMSYDVKGCDTPGRFATGVAVIFTELVLFLK